MQSVSRAFVGVGCAVLLGACSAADSGSYVIPKPGSDDAAVRVDAARTDARADTGRATDGGATSPDGGAPGLDGSTAAPDGSTAAPDGADGADGGTAVTCAYRETCDDGVDNNCNGRADEGCACIPGMTQRCYAGPPAQAGRGVCTYGSQTCEGTGEFGSWSACAGSGAPQPVVCGRMMDFRCNGNIDEGCECEPGATRDCYSGPTGTASVGACRAGSQTCAMTSTGSAWGACTGEVLPGMRDLCDGVDRDCDGAANTGCTCVLNAARPCYSGPAGTQGVGLCRAGTQRCVAGPGGVGTGWAACTGEVLPAVDMCDGVDRNCDNLPNTGCTCAVGATRACYTGPAATAGVGICRPGTQTCTRATATSTAWATACAGQVTPAATETCANSRDDNCNGMVDEGCVTTPMCPTGFDLLNDRNNCGRCGNVCPAGQACANGVCVGDGQLRITLVWDRAGDLDLHVVPPCGTEISYRLLAACGGTLDRDDIPGTGPENVFWAGTPAAGTYVVCANPYGISGTTNFTLTVNRGTTLVRRFTGSRATATSYVACSRTSANFVGTFTYP